MPHPAGKGALLRHGAGRAVSAAWQVYSRFVFQGGHLSGVIPVRLLINGSFECFHRFKMIEDGLGGAAQLLGDGSGIDIFRPRFPGKRKGGFYHPFFRKFYFWRYADSSL